LESITPFRRWVIASILFTVITLLCIVYLDHPVAEFLEKNFRHTPTGIWIEKIFLHADLLVVFPCGFMLSCGLWVMSGRKLTLWAERLMVCCWSMVFALLVTLVLKQFFGRTACEIWVYRRMDFAVSGFSDFHLFHGGAGRQGFPSGTASIVAAIGSVMWMYSVKMRPLVILLAVIPMMIVSVNYHFVADIVAGGFLGVTIGLMTVRLLDNENHIVEK
jgi:membrane-associated phospholipid phosphatase